MIKVLVNGCNGNMGKELIKHINQTDEFIVSCGFDKTISRNNDFPTYCNFSAIKNKPDVIIDFSIPFASINMLNYARKKHIPMVIATTGFNSNQLKFITECSKYIPIFMSSNMSFEINVMNFLVSKLSKILSDNDIEIIETHHRDKIDSPSGTALILANTINSSRNQSMNFTYNRSNFRAKRSKNELGIHSIRGGTEVGKHTVLFLGDNESFEITHTVSSRSVFANGALKAATFIINQKYGLFGMDDLVSFN